jgi:hypothetical protein
MACLKCGQIVYQGSVVFVRGAGKNRTPIEMCPACADGLRKAFELETQDPRLGTGILVGVGAALIASLVWYAVVVGTQYEVGFVAIGVGWLVAQAVMVGAGRKRGASLQLVSVGITLLAMTIGEYFILHHFLVLALAEKGMEDVPLLLPLSAAADLVGSGLLDDPLTLIFWAIAIYAAFRLPAKRRLAVLNR